MEKSTKSKILEAATELMAESGYSGASMRRIAKRVGIRESAIYNHFKNKEAIFETILENLFHSAFDEFFAKRSIEEEACKGKRFLKEYVMAYKLISFDPKHEKFFRIILIEMMREKKVRELFMKHFFDKDVKMLAQAFFVMMQHDLVRSDDPKLMAQEFLSPLFTMRLQIMLLHLNGSPTTSFSTLFERHVDFFWQGVAIVS